MYLTEFKNNEDVVSQYAAPEDALKDAEMLLAWYGYGSYCGSSFVLFRRDGKLWEVNGSHCSCYGLEGQWEPQETLWAELVIRKIYDGDDGAGEAQAALSRLVGENLTTAEISEAFAAVKRTRVRHIGVRFT